MIVAARVDDRLIHGQVATTWIGGNSVQVIVIVDDAVAADDMQKAVLKMAAPAGVKVYAQSVEKFTEKYKQGILDSYRVMLIFANVYAPRALIENGIPIPSLNIGGMAFRGGRTQISKALSLTSEEAAVLRALAASGVEVEHRQRYTDAKQAVIPMLEGKI